MGNQKGLKLSVIVFCLLVLPLVLRAQTNISTIKVEEEAKKAAAKQFNISVSLESASNMFDKNSPDREAANSLDIIPSYDLGSGYSVGGRAIVNKDETEAKETTVSNMTVSFKKKGPNLTPNLGSVFGVTGVAPTNEPIRKETRFQGGARLSIQLKGVYRKLTYYVGSTANRNFHQFTQAADGSNNVQYTLSSDLALELEFVPNWTIAASGYGKTGWTYQDSSRQAYGNEFSISNQVAKQFSLTAGFRNEGAAFKADGVSSNIKIYDQNSSVVFAALTVTN